MKERLWRYMRVFFWSCVTMVGALVGVTVIGALFDKVPFGIVILVMFGVIFLIVDNQID